MGRIFYKLKNENLFKSKRTSEMDNDMKKVFEQCVKRWEKYGMDDRIEDAINVFNTKWLNDEKIIEQKEIVLKLLKKFDYYSRKDKRMYYRK